MRQERAHEWYALHVMTGWERTVHERTRQIAEADSVLPVERYLSRDGLARERVLLPGYAFVRCVMTAEMWQRLRQMSGVIRILGYPYEAIPEWQMETVLALSRHGETGLIAQRAGGVTQLISGALAESAHEVVRADERRGTVTVALDLPGGIRTVTVHAEFV